MPSENRPVATSRRHIEYYQGYQPYHERQYVGTKDGITQAPDRKYTDVPLATVSLADQDLLKSTKEISFNASTAQPAPRSSFPALKGYRAKPNPELLRGHRSLRDYKESSESGSTPGLNWQTTYRQQFSGWEAHEQASRAHSATLARYHFRLNADDYHKKHHADLLQPAPLVSSSQIDYGHPDARRLQQGSSPPSGIPGASVDQFNLLSHAATTSDLFLGTAKGTIRIPGYRGHVPASSHNRHRLTQPVVEPGVKNLLAETYALDLPGYTGYQPKARPAPHETRKIENMPAPPVGPQTTFLLDSMATNMV